MTTLYIGTQSNPNHRKQIVVSDADAAMVLKNRGQKGIQMVVTDITTGNAEYIKTASCGLSTCYCALDFA